MVVTKEIMEVINPIVVKKEPRFMRYCELHKIPEVKEIHGGLDLRHPMYRRELFLRLYEFFLNLKGFPGGVYYFIPKLREKLKWDKEQTYWFCFINGCTQNPTTSYIIWYHFPEFDKVDKKKLEEWHSKYWKLLDYDIDRRHQKGHFVKQFLNYKEIVERYGDGSQVALFEEYLANTSDPKYNFQKVWDFVMDKFFMYGRLSTFSYTEYLFIAGLSIECNSLFMDDLQGSKSHRNGIAKVLGRDDLDWHHSNPSFRGYDKATIQWLSEEADLLLKEAKDRMKDKPYSKLINYWTLESTLCNFKSWFRPDRRYSNVYNDMAYDRIVKAEKLWEGILPRDFFQIFWDIRKEVLPQWARSEDYHYPFMKGISRFKQNFFRLSGKVLFMENMWPELDPKIDWDKIYDISRDRKGR